MPLSDSVPQIVLVNNETDLIPLPVSGGVAVASGSNGLLILGVESGSNLSQFLTILSGALLISGSVTVNNPSAASTASLGSVAQGSSGSTSWKVELNSGSIQAGTERSPLIVRPPAYFITNFGQTRVAQSYTLLDSINKYGLDLNEFATSSVGAGTITSVTSQSAVRLGIGTGATDSARVRSHSYYRYQAGKEQQVKLTGYHEAPLVANQVRRWGYFDDSNGIFFATSGSNFGVYRRSSAIGGTVVDTFISQSAWNIDRLDGTGDSGVNLNLRLAQIYEFHIDWLGVGIAEFYVNGILAHRLSNPNSFAGPYMSTAQLPVAVDVQNSAASTSGSFVFICSSVESAGGQKPPKYNFAAYNASDVTVSTTEIPILAIRPGLTFRGIENRIQVFPENCVVSTEGSRAAFRVILNPTTITGGTWVSSSVSSSCVEFNSTSTAFTGGETIYRGFMPLSQDVREANFSSFFSENARNLRLNGFGTSSDTLLIVGINEAAGSTAMRATLTWAEVR